METEKKQSAGKRFFTKLGHLIFDRFGYKVLALVSAVLIWLLIGIL